MKKLSCFLSMLLIVVMFGLTQCAYAAVTLSFWHEHTDDPYLSAVNKLVDKFMSENPDIRIKHRPIENEQFFTVLRTGFTGGQPPDTFQHEGHNNVWQFVRPGLVLDISDWFIEHQDRFNPGTEQSVKYYGKYWGIPWLTHTCTQLYSNGVILDEHGIEPPDTWKRFLEDLQKLKDENVTPIAFANKFGWSGAQWLFSFLIRWVGSEKVLDLCARKPGLHWTDPDMVQAARFYEELNDRGFFSKGKASDDYPAGMALFFAGKSPFFHSGSWFIADYTGMAPPGFDFKVSLFPQIAGQKGDPDEIVMQALEGLSISKATKHPEAGLEFLEFMSRKENAEIWVKETQSVSAVSGAVNEKTAGKFLMQIVEEQVKDNTGSIPFLEHILPKEVGEDAIWMGSVGILTGELTAETWMQRVEEEAQKHKPVIE